MTFDPEIWRRLPVDLRAEISENVMRKDLTPSELDAARRRFEPLVAKVARERQREGGRKKGDGKLPPAQKFKTRDVVAGLLGTSRRTLDKIAEVVDAAEKDPEKYGKHLKEMNGEGNPDGAYQQLRAEQRIEKIRRDVAPEVAEPVLQPGDICVLGDHWLMCGDSTKADDVERLLAGAVPPLMVTDPPFGVNFDAGRRASVLGRQRVPRSVLNDDRADWREAYALFPGNVAYVYCSKLKSDIVIAGLEAVDLMRRDHLVSVKPHFVLGQGHYHPQYESCWYVVRRGKKARWQEKARNKSDVWMIALADADDGRDDRTYHGAQKPLECMLRPIEDNSEPGDTVYDPFVGSGTTIIAAEIAKRQCYGMDLDPVCCTEAIERWQNFTGRQAIPAETGQTFEEVKAERLGTDHHPQETP
jgi:hypothetical protein